MSDYYDRNSPIGFSKPPLFPGGGGGADVDGGGGRGQESDEFRMYAFKIKRCSKTRSHDWTECPYAHRGEKARRRDPRKHPYVGVACAEFRHAGGCSKGQHCEFAHGVFEFWLHPTRYRTRACKAGLECRRKVCFFAHTPEQLREGKCFDWCCGCWVVAAPPPVERMELQEAQMERECEDISESMRRLMISSDDGDMSDSPPPDIDWICELVK